MLLKIDRRSKVSPILTIIRSLVKRYGFILTCVIILVCFQVFSGFYILRYGVPIRGEESTIFHNSGHKKSIFDNSKIGNSFKVKDQNDNIIRDEHFNILGGKKNLNHSSFQGDAHNKGPPYSEKRKISLQDLDIHPPCAIKSKEAISAIYRAKTNACRKQIANLTCQIEGGLFYPKSLRSVCPSNGSVRGKWIGCFIDDRNNRILKGYFTVLKNNSPNICLDVCFQRGFFYSGVQYSKECLCGNEEVDVKKTVADSECDMNCSGNFTKNTCGGFLRIGIYQTGLSKTIIQPLKLPSQATGNAVRIAFLLTLNGRAVRQVHRLIKALYHVDHYFFIHVDSRQHYLYNELLKLEGQYANIKLSRFRLSSIWGGASLLTVILQCMKQLLSLDSWKWDFVINLSESDFPLKSNGKLVQFLTANRERNFLKSHGNNTNKFLQKQGLDRTFFECETHMWRIGERRLPLGIRFDGGSDWICLNRRFIEYVIHSEDELVSGLRKLFSYTLLPAESFFHTVLRNSVYCQTFSDNNLHLTNWKRKFGCHCQYKNIVDWCGCSPNAFTLDDWKKLETSQRRNLFFGRKFEPSVNLMVINKLEQYIYGPYRADTPNLLSYWENRFHSNDPHMSVNDVDLTLYYAAMRLSAVRLSQSLDIIDNISIPLDHHTKCDIVPLHIRQGHFYYVEDKPQGVLIEFVARDTKSKGISTFVVETLLRQKYFNRFPIRFNNSHQLNDVQINTNFDLKEQLFRNIGSAIGPEDEITVATWWDITTNAEEKEQSLHPLIVLLDPNGNIVSEAALKVDKDNQVVSHSFTNLPKPLQPGEWTVLVIFEDSLLVLVDFPVLLLQFKNGETISIKDVQEFFNGSDKAYLPVDKSNYSHLLTNVNRPLWRSREAYQNLSDGTLIKWIDEIVDRYYTIKMCYFASPSIPTCLTSSYLICSDVHWSSSSPDPKSALGDIDVSSGYMKRPFLLPYPRE